MSDSQELYYKACYTEIEAVVLIAHGYQHQDDDEVTMGTAVMEAVTAKKMRLLEAGLDAAIADAQRQRAEVDYDGENGERKRSEAFAFMREMLRRHKGR